MKQTGAYIIKTIVTNRNGVPDIIACINGIFVAFEVKQPGKSATKLQEWNIDEIQKAGGKAFCVHSLDEVKDALKIIEKKY